jgi:hypothetical protein
MESGSPLGADIAHLLYDHELGNKNRQKRKKQKLDTLGGGIIKSNRHPKESFRAGAFSIAGIHA